MEVSEQHNQSYWFVVREDQNNVLFSSSHCDIQNPPVAEQETEYIVETSNNRQYIQVENVQPTVIETVPITEAVPDTELVPVVETVPITETEPFTETVPIIETLPITEEVPVTKPATKPRLLIHDDNFWDRNRIKLLLTLCLDRKFKCPDTDKILWNEICILIGVTPEDCEKKYTALKRTYITLLKRKRLGHDVKWIHFSLCDSVFKHCKTLSPALLEPWEDSKIRKLLNLYIENLNQFRKSNNLKKDIWKVIAAQLDTTDYNCYHKFKSLRRIYFKYLHRSHETGKAFKWPYQQYFAQIYDNYTPNVLWDKNKIRALINEYSERRDKFRNPKFQKKDLWKEIGQKLGEHPDHCDRKFRNLKQSYYRLKRRASSRKSPPQWRYYKDFEALFDGEYNAKVENQKQLEPNYVERLLSFCIRHKEKFRNPLVKKRPIWKQIGPKVRLTPEECDKKFRNLKQTYIRLVERGIGKDSGWPYFTYFEQIYGPQKTETSPVKYNVNKLTLPEMRQLVNNLQLRDSEKFNDFIVGIDDANNIQRERNRILLALLSKKIWKAP